VKKPFYKKSILEIPDIEVPACEYARLRGWLVEKVVSQTRNGWPDRFFLRHGRVVLCEFKKPGKEPTIQQAKRHKELRDAGAEVVWFDSLEHAKEYFA
jgi:hypothetical protein